MKNNNNEDEMFFTQAFYEYLCMYADQNSGAARRCPDTASLGMEEELLRALKKNHVRIVTSSDAHWPEDVGDKIREMQEGIER